MDPALSRGMTVLWVIAGRSRDFAPPRYGSHCHSDVGRSFARDDGVGADRSAGKSKGSRGMTVLWVIAGRSRDFAPPRYGSHCHSGVGRSFARDDGVGRGYRTGAG